MSCSILELNNEDARQFFLQSDCYCDFNLPLYFDFQPLLNKIADCTAIPRVLPDDLQNRYTASLGKVEKEKVNYCLYTNKDGKLAWRPFQLINPIAYVYLVNIMTNKESWKQINNRFNLFQVNENIVCCSIPLVKNGSASKREAINSWLESFEKKAIKKSLEYNYMIATDISNCYSSIYTHSIAWALDDGGKEGAKKNENEVNLSNMVDIILRDISYKQTNGIPQGSVLMDFIAEIVLGYADLLLSDMIAKKKTIKKNSYYILRYRDDYKIFTKNKTDAEIIAKYLSKVLADLSLRLNENKTFISENIITDSQKSDKLYLRDISERNNLETRILQIHSLSEKYPNSGSINKMLERYCDDIEDESLIIYDLQLIASVAVDIAYRNPRTYPYIITILGRIDELLSKKESSDLFKKVINKTSSIPNSEYLNIWLQRLSKKKRLRRISDESYPLCKYVKDYMKNSDPRKVKINRIWDFSTFNDSAIPSLTKTVSIISIDKYNEMSIYPNTEEIKIFKQYE